MVFVGLAAGGKAGNASDAGTAADLGGPRDAGLEVGTELPGVEEDEVIAHEIPPAVGRGAGPAVRFALAVVGLGRPGKPFADDAEAVPQDALRDAEERDDCAVEDLSFRTREEFFAGAGADDGVEAVTWAQPRGKELPLMPLGPGRDG
jgi:hypothetical protein